MSVDAKVIVTCGKDKMFEVIGAVTTQLNVYSRNKLDEYIKTVGLVNRSQYFSSDHKEKYTNGCNFHGDNADLISFQFGSGDDHKRSLSMFCGCISDYNDTVEGDKIIFSVGCWGKSDEIMKQLCLSLAHLGDVYYDHNDCDEEEFVLMSKLEGDHMTIKQISARVIKQVKLITGKEVTLESTIESLGMDMDSLDYIECIMAFEEEFNIDIEEGVYLEFDSILSVIGYVHHLNLQVGF